MHDHCIYPSFIIQSTPSDVIYISIPRSPLHFAAHRHFIHSECRFHPFGTNYHPFSMPLIWFCDPSFSNCFSLQHHPLTSRHCQLSSSKPSTTQPFQHLIVIWYSTSTPVVIFLPSAFSSCHITLSYCQASARTPPFHLYYQHSHSALTRFGLIFHQVIEGCFSSSNRHHLLILLSIFP